MTLLEEKSWPSPPQHRTLLEAADYLPMFHGVLVGLLHMHRCGIVHHDIKMDNILLACRQDPGSVQIADLAFAKLIGSPTWAEGALGFTAPELEPKSREFTTIPADPNQDGFSVGILFAQMLTGLDAMTVQHYYQTGKLVHHLCNLGVADELARGICALLNHNPEERIGLGALHQTVQANLDVLNAAAAAALAALQGGNLLAAPQPAGEHLQPPTDGNMVSAWSAPEAIWTHQGLADTGIASTRFSPVREIPEHGGLADVPSVAEPAAASGWTRWPVPADESQAATNGTASVEPRCKAVGQGLNADDGIDLLFTPYNNEQSMLSTVEEAASSDPLPAHIITAAPSLDTSSLVHNPMPPAERDAAMPLSTAELVTDDVSQLQLSLADPGSGATLSAAPGDRPASNASCRPDIDQPTADGAVTRKDGADTTDTWPCDGIYRYGLSALSTAADTATRDPLSTAPIITSVPTLNMSCPPSSPFPTTPQTIKHDPGVPESPKLLVRDIASDLHWSGEAVSNGGTVPTGLGDRCGPDPSYHPATTLPTTDGAATSQGNGKTRDSWPSHGVCHVEHTGLAASTDWATNALLCTTPTIPPDVLDTNYLPCGLVQMSPQSADRGAAMPLSTAGCVSDDQLQLQPSRECLGNVATLAAAPGDWCEPGASLQLDVKKPTTAGAATRQDAADSEGVPARHGAYRPDHSFPTTAGGSTSRDPWSMSPTDAPVPSFGTSCPPWNTVQNPTHPAEPDHAGRDVLTAVLVTDAASQLQLSREASGIGADWSAAHGDPPGPRSICQVDTAPAADDGPLTHQHHASTDDMWPSDGFCHPGCLMLATAADMAGRDRLCMTSTITSVPSLDTSCPPCGGLVRNPPQPSNSDTSMPASSAVLVTGALSQQQPSREAASNGLPAAAADRRDRDITPSTVEGHIPVVADTTATHSTAAVATAPPQAAASAVPAGPNCSAPSMRQIPPLRHILAPPNRVADVWGVSNSTTPQDDVGSAVSALQATPHSSGTPWSIEGIRCAHDEHMTPGHSLCLQPTMQQQQPALADENDQQAKCNPYCAAGSGVREHSAVEMEEIASFQEASVGEARREAEEARCCRTQDAESGDGPAAGQLDPWCVPRWEQLALAAGIAGLVAAKLLFARR